MNEAVAIVVGSFALVMASVFVTAHYCQEQVRRKRLRELDYRHYWSVWRNARY